jgi:hypothetical protein
LLRESVAHGWEELKQRVKGDPGLTLKRFEVERLEAIARQVTDELEGLRLATSTLAQAASLQDAAEPGSPCSFHSCWRRRAYRFGNSTVGGSTAPMTSERRSRPPSSGRCLGCRVAAGPQRGGGQAGQTL